MSWLTRPARIALRTPVIALIATPLLAAPALAQTSSSTALISTSNTGSVCNSASGWHIGGSNASCPAQMAGGATFSSTTSSDNVTRTVASSTTGAQITAGSGATAESFSYQNGTITVNGMNAAATSLVFHFDATATQSLTGGATGQGITGFTLWGFNLVGRQGADIVGTTTGVSQTQQFNGTTQGPNIYGGVATSNGFDFTLPFNPAQGSFLYYFYPITVVQFANQPAGATASSSFWAMLTGIDVTDDTGHAIGTVALDAQGGTISFSSVPEPGSMALLGTGLIGLIPVMRRRV